MFNRRNTEARRRRGYIPIVTALVAMFALACGDASETLVQPEVTRAAHETRVLYDGSGNAYVVVAGLDGDGSVEGVIGAAGGMMTLNGHTLLVPEGAVRGATTFKMTLVDQTAIHVDLTATSTAEGAENNGVGHAGFAVPVELRLSYEKASSGFDPHRMYISWYKPDGSIEVKKTTVHADQQEVRAGLEHFSGYIIVAN